MFAIYLCPHQSYCLADCSVAFLHDAKDPSALPTGISQRILG